MKNIILLPALFIIFIAAVSAVSVRVHPYDYTSGNLGMVVVIMDHQDNYDGARATLDMPDLDAASRTNVFDSDRDEAKRLYYDIELPANIKPDYYPVRVVITDDDGNRKKTHSWVFVG